MPLPDRTGQRERGDEREHQDAPDSEHADDLRRGRRIRRRQVGSLVERPDRRRGPRGVVVAQRLVGPVVDVTDFPLGLEIVERTEQEVTLALEGGPIEVAHAGSSCSAR